MHYMYVSWKSKLIVALNKLHEKTLRLVLYDHVSDFDALLRKNDNISCHHRNIQMLMNELYIIKNELAPPIMDTMLNRRNITFNFRNLQSFGQKEKELFLMETLSYRIPQLWIFLLEEIKQRNPINLFKSDVKQWTC